MLLTPNEMGNIMEANEKMGKCNTSNRTIIAWVEEQAKLCQPDEIFWCDGSESEKVLLTAEAVDKGILIKLNQEKLPGCYYHRSNPNDVARVEQCTYICTETRDEAGPTNNWAAPKEMYQKLLGLARGSMHGRTMYVVPYLMGPLGSPLTKVGIELTDSIYVVLSMRIMARMGDVAYKHLGNRDDFNRGLHCMLDVNPERRYICHFPQDNTIISVGSAYGGNALLGKKCLALRIGSYLGRKEGWMAEHMLILGVESPTGEKTYVAAAFPSACGKTNFAMMIPPAHFKGWKIWTVGDDIAWMKPGPDGRLYAINPEAGYFGVMPGTNYKSNLNAMKSIQKDTIYTNVALTPDLDVWWEGKDGPPPKECLDWRGNKWTPESKEKAAHPNSRFAAPMINNPMLAPEANDPSGVPISAIIFGGRRADTMPLVFQAFNWIHGVYVGATMGSEMTAAAAGTLGQVRRDPMAMLPFCGYNMGYYFHHWIIMRKLIKYPPRIFHVNWFRKDANGEFLWPGFGENMRVLKWIVDRCKGRANANETPLGWVPGPESFDLGGLEGYTPEKLSQAQTINYEDWRRELLQQDELFMKLYSNLPKEMIFQRELLVSRL
ncbi:Phosphoenolpyruvate carboxykinase (GTP) [Pedosphaera parvula Ellin514]|uniref:Phosphoenolpyruvate carboxykinase [GTP] n=2 Tax=Pedosphaera TaxID=1032526 RepID=B9XIC7_PEDPL|nr:Phosphoenolpyruvate carboxykinase (GTP) [Pedosphaera parvula Ellin514]